jgi:hypothetical protein
MISSPQEAITHLKEVEGISFIFERLSFVKDRLKLYEEFFKQIVVKYLPDGKSVYVGFIHHGTETLPEILYFNEEGGHYW